MGPIRTWWPALAVAALLAGCGGGGGGESTQLVRGPGFAFQAPAGWETTRTTRAAVARPGGDSPELVSVTRFPLVKPFRPALWPKVVKELDRVAGKLATKLDGRLDSSATVRIGGLRGRSYVITHSREGRALRQRLDLLLAHRMEFQLLCGWDVSEGEPDACSLLEESFRLA